MKAIKILFLAFTCFQVYAQSQLNISVEDPFTFERIPNAYVMLESPKEGVQLYQADKNGIVTIPNIAGTISLSCISKGYQALQTDFEIDEDLDVQFILTPEIEPVIDDKNDFLVEGKVRDSYSGQVITNATISFGKQQVKTDAEGYLRIPNDFFDEYKFEEGDSIQYQLSAPNFETVTDYYYYAPVKLFADYRLDSQLTKRAENSQMIDDDAVIEEIQQEMTESLENYSVTSRCPSVRSTIKVGLNCRCNSCSRVSVMYLETYTQKGIDNEWIPSWRTESLKAGSVAYRSYGAYHILHRLNSRYDISNTTCRQVFRSDYTSRCVSAARATSGQLLVKNNRVAFTEYSAENNSRGLRCGDGYAGNGSPCISDPVCRGTRRFGHGRGMCQWGSQRWARQGKSYTWILDHYYRPYGIYRCSGSSGGGGTPPAKRADLQVTKIWTSPTYPCRNGYSRIYVTVKNIGSATSNAVRYTRKINGQVAFTGTIPALAPGRSITYYRSYRFGRSGRNTYCVYVNRASSETNTSNNNKCMTVNVRNCGRPDVSITDSNMKSTEIEAGSEVDLTWDWSLEGELQDDQPSELKMNYFLSSDCTYSSDDILIATEIQNLSENDDIEASEFAVKSLKLPASVRKGEYYILIQADSDNMLEESDETNNTVCLKVSVDDSQILGNDLQTAVAISPNPTSGVVNLKYDSSINIIKIEIFDTNGLQVKAKEGKNLQSIDLSDLSPNYYILKVYDDQNQSSMYKVIKN